jgi:hypothetical protein
MGDILHKFLFFRAGYVLFSSQISKFLHNDVKFNTLNVVTR